MKKDDTRGRMLCASRGIQAFLFAVACCLAWEFVPEWLAPGNKPIRTFLTWMAGIVLFGVTLLFMYAFECVAGRG